MNSHVFSDNITQVYNFCWRPLFDVFLNGSYTDLMHTPFTSKQTFTSQNSGGHATYITGLVGSIQEYPWLDSTGRVKSNLIFAVVLILSIQLTGTKI